MGFYDGLKLYASLLNESRGTTTDVTAFARNGTAIANLLKNRTFQSVSGTRFINANGDTEGRFAMNFFNYSAGAFQVGTTYIGDLYHDGSLLCFAVHSLDQPLIFHPST